MICDLKCEIIRNEELSAGVFKMTLAADKLPEILAGQFCAVQIPKADLLLRRPFGINGFDYKEGTFDILFRVRGAGTAVLAGMTDGQELQVLLPLGNGFTLAAEHKTVLLLGGGMGIAPLLPVPKSYPDKKYYSFLGFKNKADAVERAEFAAVSEKVFIATEDGSLGEKGYAVRLIEKHLKEINPDVILACGPNSMFAALSKIKTSAAVFVSLEERMACGVGACLVCACAVKNGEEIHKKRVCRDGPVFPLGEVSL